MEENVRLGTKNVMLNSGQAPFTNEDMMKSGILLRKYSPKDFDARPKASDAHQKVSDGHQKAADGNMKMKNQQRGFKRWLLRKKCREPFTLHFLSVNCLVSVFYMGEGVFRPFTTLHCPSPH